MIGIDTNVLVRALTADDVVQTRRVRELLDRNEVFVATTVVLEAEWVLRSRFGFAKAAVVEAMRTFSRLPQVSFEHPERVARAFELVDAGMDFADALHLLAAESCERFLTFDRRLARTGQGGLIEIERL